MYSANNVDVLEWFYTFCRENIIFPSRTDEAVKPLFSSLRGSKIKSRELQNILKDRSFKIFTFSSFYNGKHLRVLL